jgi:hypothetical protein
MSGDVLDDTRLNGIAAAADGSKINRHLPARTKDRAASSKYRLSPEPESAAAPGRQLRLTRDYATGTQGHAPRWAPLEEAAVAGLARFCRN